MTRRRSPDSFDLFEQAARSQRARLWRRRSRAWATGGPGGRRRRHPRSAHPVAGLADSKVLSAERREALAMLIRERSVAFAVAEASVEEIDRLNILQATLLAMQRAVDALAVQAEYALIDGNQMPRLAIPGRTIVAGDASEPCISAASILAKTARDAIMQAFDTQHPGYGFARHMGYATPEHLASLARLGACRLHRRSFAPVRAQLAAG